MIVSIVIPTYRRPKLLFRCLEALLQQKYERTEYEIIVVSDSPDPDTENLINEFSGYISPRIRFMFLPEKKGPAAARNMGWLSASGRIIAFTDDDCIPDLYWIEHIVKHCDPNGNFALSGRVIVPIGKRPTDYAKNTANLESAEFITANCACTKDVLVKAGGFDEQFSMAWREDSDLEFKLIGQAIRIKKVAEAIVVHPVRESDWGVSIKEQKKTMYDALLYKKHPQLFLIKIRSRSPVMYYCIIAFFLITILGSFVSQNIAVAGLTGWLILTMYFIYKRLYATSLSFKHIAEIVATSLVIPFLSVFWQWYGAVKYRVMFI